MKTVDYNSINFRNSDVDRMSGKFGKEEPKPKKNAEQKIADIDNNKRLNRVVERRYERMDRKYENAQGNSEKTAKLDKKYGYNYEGAKAAGIQPDETGHWGSIGNDGLILKGPKHPSMVKTKKVEGLLGNKIVKRDGNLYSVPKK